jgi:hypothetical protein
LTDVGAGIIFYWLIKLSEMENIWRISNCLEKCNTKIYERTRPCCVNNMDLNNVDIKESISYQYKTLKEFLVQSAAHHMPVVLTC